MFRMRDHETHQSGGCDAHTKERHRIKELKDGCDQIEMNRNNNIPSDETLSPVDVGCDQCDRIGTGGVVLMARILSK